jgi:hypothetical protein
VVFHEVSSRSHHKRWFVIHLHWFAIILLVFASTTGNTEFSIWSIVSYFPSMTPPPWLSSLLTLKIPCQLKVGFYAYYDLFYLIKLNIESNKKFVNPKNFYFLVMVAILCRFSFIIIEHIKVSPQQFQCVEVFGDIVFSLMDLPSFKVKL